MLFPVNISIGSLLTTCTGLRGHDRDLARIAAACSATVLLWRSDAHIHSHEIPNHFLVIAGGGRRATRTCNLSLMFQIVVDVVRECCMLIVISFSAHWRIYEWIVQTISFLIHRALIHCWFSHSFGSFQGAKLPITSKLQRDAISKFKSFRLVPKLSRRLGSINESKKASSEVGKSVVPSYDWLA